MDSEDSIEYQIAAYVYKSFTVVFLLVGTVTNILSAIVYSKKHMRKSSYSVYLFALAIVDLLVTINGNVRLFLMSYEIDLFKTAQNFATWKLDDTSPSARFLFKGFDIRLTSLAMCKIHRFSTYYLLQVSSLIIAMLSIDRFFGCVLVHKTSRFFKPSCACKLVICLLVLFFLFNLHFLIFVGYEKVNNNLTNLTNTSQLTHSNQSVLPHSNDLNNSRSSSQGSVNIVIYCEPDPVYPVYLEFWKIYFYLDSLFYCVLPFLIMLVCNVSIIAKIIKSRVKSKQVIVTRNRKTNSSVLVKNKSYSMLAAEKRISIILILISFSFFILTAPVFIIENVEQTYYHKNVPLAELLLSLAYMFMYMNHVINFFFYCSIGPNFRNEVKKLIPRMFLRHNEVAPLKSSKVNTVYVATSACYNYSMRKNLACSIKETYFRRQKTTSTTSMTTKSMRKTSTEVGLLVHTMTTTSTLSSLAKSQNTQEEILQTFV